MADEPKDPAFLETKPSRVINMEAPVKLEHGSGNDSGMIPFSANAPTSSDSILDFNFFQNQFFYDRFVALYSKHAVMSPRFPAGFATPEYLKRLLSGMSSAPPSIDLDSLNPTLSDESQFYFPRTIPRINLPNYEVNPVRSLSDLLKTLPLSIKFMTLEDYGKTSDPIRMSQEIDNCHSHSDEIRQDRKSRMIPEVVKTEKPIKTQKKSSSASEEHWKGFQSYLLKNNEKMLTELGFPPGASFIKHKPLLPLTKLDKDEIDPSTKIMTKDELNWQLAIINAGQEEVYLNPELSLFDKNIGKRVCHPCLFNIEGPRQFPQFVPKYPKGFKLLRTWKKSIGESLETITAREKIEFKILRQKLAVEHRKQRKRGWIEPISWGEWKTERKKQQKSRKLLIREEDSTMEVDEDSPGTSSDMT